MTIAVIKIRSFFEGWNSYLSTLSSSQSSQNIHEWQEEDPENPQCVKYNPVELSYLHEVLHQYFCRGRVKLMTPNSA